MPYLIIHGEEEFLRSEEIGRLKAEFSKAGLGDLNCTVLDGHKLTLPVLREACETMPFLADRRLVLVYDLLSRFDPSTKDDENESAETHRPDSSLYKDIAAYLEQIPSFTWLVFCESSQLTVKNPVFKAAQARKEAIKLYSRLPDDALPGWVTRRVVWWQTRYAQEGGGSPDNRVLSINGDAARALVHFVGNNLRQLDAEIEKLAGFANYGTIELEHVQKLASENLEARIFTMVDSLGRRERRNALHELQVLLATGAHPLYILTMVIRQYRLLKAIKDLQSEGKGNSARALQQELQLPEFLADKLMQQARLYRDVEVERLFEMLVLTDQGIKTGRIEGRLALELFVLDATRSIYQGSNSERTRRASSSSVSSPEARSR